MQGTNGPVQAGGSAGLSATGGSVPHAVPHPGMVTLRQPPPPKPWHKLCHGHTHSGMGCPGGGDPCSKLLEVPSLLGVTPSQCRHKPGHPRG